MNPQPDGVQSRVAAPDTSIEVEDQEPGLVDAIRFLYRWRIKLAFYFLTLFILGVLAFSWSRLKSPRDVEGVVGLNFPEMAKGAYPSGRRFSIEDFRSPGVLSRALADAAISSQRISLMDLAAHVNVTPVVPEEIQNRWKKQEQKGEKKEEYAPSELTIEIEENGLTSQELLRLFDGLVRRYQEIVKYDQQSGKRFMAPWDSSYESLVGSYDSWDIPELFERAYRTMSANLRILVGESAKYQDLGYQLSFLEVNKDLDTWARTRLQPLEALTYQGRLVKDRDVIAQRIQYSLQELEIRIRQKSNEAAEADRLLEIIGRPKTLVSGQLNTQEGLIIDASALDRLVKSDYVGPVVQRISKLQEEVQAIQAEKARLEKQLSLLPKSAGVGLVTLPPGYQRLIARMSEDLNATIQKYNRGLEDYLTATITSLVVVKQAPVVSRAGYSPILVLPGIAFLSAFLAIFLLGIERLFERAREEEPA
jgi:hypothetical protein